MRKRLPPLIVIAAVIITAAVYPRIPERMPTHWNMHGEIDGWSSRLWGAWLIPLLLPVMWGIFKSLPHIDPRKENYAKFASTYEWIVALVMGFLLLMQGIVLAAATGHAVPMERVIPAGVGLMFLVLGNLLPRARAKWLMGAYASSGRIRVRTHRTSNDRHGVHDAGAGARHSAVYRRSSGSGSDRVFIHHLEAGKRVSAALTVSTERIGTSSGSLPSWVILVIALVIIIADRITKVWAVANLTYGVPKRIAGEYLRFTLNWNQGAAMGSTLGSFSRVGFSLAAVVVLVMLAAFYR